MTRPRTFAGMGFEEVFICSVGKLAEYCRIGHVNRFVDFPRIPLKVVVLVIQS